MPHIPRWQLRPDAGLRKASPCGGYPMEQQEIHEHEALGGGAGRRLYCRLTSGQPEPANNFAGPAFLPIGRAAKCYRGRRAAA